MICPISGMDLDAGNRERIAQLERELAEAKAWKERVIDACVINCISWDETNPQKTIADLISWEVKIALDPAVNEQQAKVYQERDTFKAELTEAKIQIQNLEAAWFECEGISALGELEATASGVIALITERDTLKRLAGQLGAALRVLDSETTYVHRKCRNLMLCDCEAGRIANQVAAALDAYADYEAATKQELK